MSKEADTKLIGAIARKDAKATAALIEGGADTRSHIGVLPLLHFAVMVSSAEIVQQLIQAGNDVNGSDDLGQRPLHYAGHNPSPDTGTNVESLIAAGADVNAKDSRGRTALDNAAGAHNMEAARRLVEAGGTSKAQYRVWLREKIGSPGRGSERG